MKFTYHTLILKNANGDWYSYATSYDKGILSLKMEKFLKSGVHRTDIAIVRNDSLWAYLKD